MVAATNRADALDDALLRPGRFDRTIYMGRPAPSNRLKILQVCAGRSCAPHECGWEWLAGWLARPGLLAFGSAVAPASPTEAHPRSLAALLTAPHAPQVHARNKPLDRGNDDALLRAIADLAIGYSGAELANLMNEAAILAVRTACTVPRTARGC